MESLHGIHFKRLPSNTDIYDAISCGCFSSNITAYLEVAFLFPWAVVFKDIGIFGFVSMMIFLGVLTIGFIYEWKKGALEWD